MMLRFANRWSGDALRALLTEVFTDVVTGMLDDVTTDVQDLADAVAALETRKAVGT
jgi:hypothetical protein